MKKASDWAVSLLAAVLAACWGAGLLLLTAAVPGAALRLFLWSWGWLAL